MRRFIRPTGEPLAQFRAGDDGIIRRTRIRESAMPQDVLVSGSPYTVRDFPTPYELLLAERPWIAERDVIMDFRRGVYADNSSGAPIFKTYAEFFEPRLAEPTGNGIAIPEASRNLLYQGLSEKNASGWIDNPDITINAIEVSDLPADVAAYVAATPSPWPVERVFEMEVTSGTGESLVPLFPAGLSGDFTASVFGWGLVGQTDMRIGANSSPDLPIDAGDRISVSANGGACNLRMNAGAKCYVWGAMFEAGLALTDYQEGYEILNRLEPRDMSFVKPNLRFTVVARFPDEGTSGGANVISFANTDRSQTCRLTVNWTGASVTLSARSAAGDDGTNTCNAGGFSWRPGQDVTFDCEVTSDGSLRLRVDGGTERTMLPGDADYDVLDLSGLNRARIGGSIPNLNAGSGTPYVISPIEGIVDQVFISGSDD